MTGTLKKLITAAAIILAAVSCKDLTPEVDQLRERLDALEKRVEALNDELRELRSLVQQINTGGYVTAVLPEKQDGQIVGYTLVFNDGSKTYISLGQKQQEVPQIGIRQDTDGIWYWTLGGEWLLDSDGKRVPASNSAEAPQQPKLKLEDGVWYISYDGGASWETIPTKTSSGSIFRSIDASNPDFVVITLSDGQQLKLPTWEAFAELQRQVKQLNINLSSISRIVSAMQNNDYLVSTTPFVEEGEQLGWILNFSKSGLVVIYSSKGASAPQIGVRQDSDGVYYWTIGGEWLLDETGKKVRAEGIQGAAGSSPRIKIEDQFWWISYDEGATWERLDRATGEDGADGDSFFREVDNSSDEFILLVLADGSSLKVPKYIPLDIVLDLPLDLVIDVNETITIPYRIVGTEQVASHVSILTNGIISADCFTYPKGQADPWDGYFTISGGSVRGTGDAVVMLNTENGNSVIRSLHFEPRACSVTVDLTSGPIIDMTVDSYVVEAPLEGATIKIQLYSNFSFTLDSSEVPWVKVISQEANKVNPEYKTITMQIEPSTEGARYGDIYINIEKGTWSGTMTRVYPMLFTVSQGLFYTSSVRRFIQASSDARTYELPLEGLSDYAEAINYDGADWLSCSLERSSEFGHILKVSLDANLTTESRTAKVAIKSGGLIVDYLTVRQQFYTYWSSIDILILTVLALPENGYEVRLPFTGTIEADIDWGDGTVSLIDNDGGTSYPARHIYQGCSTPTEFTVLVAGRVSEIRNCDAIAPYASIREVKQWGSALGLRSMENAFRDCKTLVSIAPDMRDALYHVTSFAGAFQGCTNLTQVPENLFERTVNATDFTDTFRGVSKVVTESPNIVINGRKVHLYELDGTQDWDESIYGIYPYPIPQKHSGCFAGGNWADQEAIHAAGWD